MYIAKWWGNMVGGSDDSLLLVDYFEHTKQARYPLGALLHDLMLDRYLGRTVLREAVELCYVVELENGRRLECDFDIAIDAVIDLCALLVEQIHTGRIDTKELFGSSTRPVVFEIEIEKEPLGLLIQELAYFCAEPLAYDLAELVDEADMLELAGMCREIVEELDTYYNAL